MAIQDKFNKPNIIYKITQDIDLNGGTLTIPSGCTLDFQGGTISNGTIIGNVLNDYLKPEWFGAKADGVTDDTDAIKMAFKLSANRIIFSKGIYCISSYIDYANSNVTIEKYATIKAISEMEYMMSGDYTPSSDVMDLNGIAIVDGGGVIDADGKADCCLTIKNSYRTDISNLKLYNAKKYCFKASKDDEIGGNTSGSINMHNCAIWNKMDIENAIGIYSNRSDSLYKEISIINFKISVKHAHGNIKYIDVHPWLSKSLFWKDSVAFDSFYPDGFYMGCEADTVRTLIKFNNYDFHKPQLIGCRSYVNDKVVSTEILNQYPPIVIDKNNTKNSVIQLFGGAFNYNVDYTFISEKSDLDMILVSNMSLTTLNPFTLPRNTALINKFSGTKNINGFWLYKGLTYYENIDPKHPFLVYFDGEKWVDAYGYKALTKIGNSSMRPLLDITDNGYEYFDTTINKPIYWNGTKWVGENTVVNAGTF